MRPKNFYHYLELMNVYAENILTYCEELQTLHLDSLNYLENGKEKNKEQLEASMIIFGAKTKKELVVRKKEEAKRTEEIIDNIAKFITFMKREDKVYNEVVTSDDYLEWVDSDSLEAFFAPINSIPVYINKYAKVKVVDLLEAFKDIMNALIIEIEELIGFSFPVDDGRPQIVSVQLKMKEKGITLDIEDMSELAHLILTYEDFEYLIKVVNKEIEKLIEPIKA